MNFLKKEPIDDLNDISYVNPEIEHKSNFALALEILIDSFFNIFPILLLTIVDAISLIVIGHLNEEANPALNFSYFNFFQIAVVYLNLFGFIFALGTLKSAKKEIFNIQEYYLNTKILLICITCLIILPMSFFSIYILEFLYGEEGEVTIKMLWYVYENYLMYAPIFAFFQLLLQLNLRILQIYNVKSTSLMIFSLHIFLHLIFSYLFVHHFGMKVSGIMLSLIITSFICYIYTNIFINNNLYIIKNFFFFPSLNIDSNSFMNTLKTDFITGIIAYLDYAGFGFFLLFSYFINETSLTTNIVLMNFFSFLHTIGNGFSSSLKHYIQLSTSSYKHSHVGKRKFIKILACLVFVIALLFSMIILFFDGSIVQIYLCTTNLNTLQISHDFTEIANFFALIIFFDYISRVLDGYVKGIDANTTHLLFYKVSFLIIFLPLGLVLCFVYNFGLLGFWAVTYIYIVIHSLLNSVFVYKYYELWMN
jgi:Na+-driven multidrug efflux pump